MCLPNEVLDVDQPFETEVEGVGWLFATLEKREDDTFTVRVEIQTDWWDEYRLWEFTTYQEQIKDGFWADFLRSIIERMEEGKIG